MYSGFSGFSVRKWKNISHHVGETVDMVSLLHAVLIGTSSKYILLMNFQILGIYDISNGSWLTGYNFLIC